MYIKSMLMKRILFFLSYFLFVYEIYGQVTLEHCLQKAQENYPLMSAVRLDTTGQRI